MPLVRLLCSVKTRGLLSVCFESLTQQEVHGPKTGFRIYSRRNLHICAFRSVAMPSFHFYLSQQIAFSLLLISDENRQEIGGRQSSLNSLFILSASFSLCFCFSDARRTKATTVYFSIAITRSKCFENERKLAVGWYYAAVT